MKIDGPKNIYTLYNTKNLSNENDSMLKDIELSQLEEMKLMDIFEKTIMEDKFQVYDLLSIKNISKEAETIYGQIKEKIEDMVTEQIKALGLLKNMDSLNIDINIINKEKILQDWTNTIKEQKLVGENSKEDISQIDKVEINRDNLSKYKSSGNKEGFFNKTKLDTDLSSEEIVVFVKNISDEGKAKLTVLGKIVIDIFSKIERDMEELPDISKKTYVRIIEKLDNLIAIEKFKDEPEGIKAELTKIIEQRKIYNIFHEFSSMYRTAQSNIILNQKGGKQFTAIIVVSLICYYIIKVLR